MDVKESIKDTVFMRIEEEYLKDLPTEQAKLALISKVIYSLLSR